MLFWIDENDLQHRPSHQGYQIDKWCAFPFSMASTANSDSVRATSRIPKVMSRILTLHHFKTNAAILMMAGLNIVNAFGALWVTWDISAGGNGHSYLAVPGFAGL